MLGPAILYASGFKFHHPAEIAMDERSLHFHVVEPGGQLTESILDSTVQQEKVCYEIRKEY